MKKILSFLVVACVPVILFAGNTKDNLLLSAPLPEPPPAYRSSMVNKTFTGVFGGYNMYMGKMADSITGMANVGFHGRYFITHNFAVSGDFAVGFGQTKITALTDGLAAIFAPYIPAGDSIPITPELPYTEIKSPAYSFHATFSIDYFLTKKMNPGKFKGYIGLGIGYVTVFRKAKIEYTDKFAWSTEPEDVFLRNVIDASIEQYNRTTGGFAISPKLGFLWTPNEYFGFIAEAKFSAIVSQPFIPALSFNAGMVFQLGNKRN